MQLLHLFQALLSDGFSNLGEEQQSLAVNVFFHLVGDVRDRLLVRVGCGSCVPHVTIGIKVLVALLDNVAMSVHGETSLASSAVVRTTVGSNLSRLVEVLQDESHSFVVETLGEIVLGRLGLGGYPHGSLTAVVLNDWKVIGINTGCRRNGGIPTTSKGWHAVEIFRQLKDGHFRDLGSWGFGIVGVDTPAAAAVFLPVSRWQVDVIHICAILRSVRSVHHFKSMRLSGR
mmetsp:Transcript_7619/g.11011  ORF Transcript_7619/g.11011 Transcript_7619/m.11011 type:complete len:230 (-) Transcript_7619:81-770(-)